MRAKLPISYGGYYITDERAMMIDRAVSALARHDKTAACVFVLTYVWQMGQRRIADEYLNGVLDLRRRNASRHDTLKKLLIAEGFINGFLRK